MVVVEGVGAVVLDYLVVGSVAREGCDGLDELGALGGGAAPGDAVAVLYAVAVPLRNLLDEVGAPVRVYGVELR